MDNAVREDSMELEDDEPSRREYGETDLDLDNSDGGQARACSTSSQRSGGDATTEDLLPEPTVVPDAPAKKTKKRKTGSRGPTTTKSERRQVAVTKYDFSAGTPCE